MEGDMKKDVKSIDKSIHRSHRLNEKSRLLSNKMSPAAEKIWEGSLQLSSSITASVVAFFRRSFHLLFILVSTFAYNFLNLQVTLEVILSFYFILLRGCLL